MTDNSENPKKAAVILALENILSELDDQRLALPALKIVEALEVLGSSDILDQSANS